MPELKCSSFSGEGSSNLEFHAFITQFNSVIGQRKLTNVAKLTYLKSYLKGYASKLIQHLQLSDSNYETALELLNSEFLNEHAIINDLYSKLLNLKPKYDPTLLETKVFINEVRCIVGDLRNYSIDLMDELSANSLISHIIFNKLPQNFKLELVRKLNNYPTLDMIFGNYSDIIYTLNLNQASAKISKSSNDNNSPNSLSKPFIVSSNLNSGDRNKTFMCKFCNSSGHSMLKCKRYSSCLLYTSPSPRDKRQSRMPSSA